MITLIFHVWLSSSNAFILQEFIKCLVHGKPWGKQTHSCPFGICDTINSPKSRHNCLPQTLLFERFKTLKGQPSLKLLKSTSCSWGQLWCSGGQSQAQTRICVVPGPCVSSSGTFRINLILGVNQRPLWVPGHMPMRSFRGLQLGFILWRVTERKNCILQASVLFLPQDYIRLGFQNGTDKLIVYDTQWHWAQGELRDMSYQKFIADPLAWAQVLDHYSDSFNPFSDHSDASALQYLRIRASIFSSLCPSLLAPGHY